jgi:type I restriction enzyme S subunit
VACRAQAGEWKMIPGNWKKLPLNHVAHVQTGLAKGKKNIRNLQTLPYLRVANVQDGYLDLSLIKSIEVEESNIDRYLLKPGDVLLTEGGDFDKLGRGAIWHGEINPCLHQNHIFVVRPKDELLMPAFLSLLTGSAYGKSYFLKCSKQSTNLASINSTQLKEFPVLLPPLVEQKKIIEITNVWNYAIEKTERLIETKEKRNKAIFHKLLFGKTRLGKGTTKGQYKTKWFSVPDDWRIVKLKSVAEEVSKRNQNGQDVPVLSCTKHQGLVDSLQFFDRQIFSKDTSPYKVVERGEFVYATNHIEEGSIGYQDLYLKGLVSPMYTVFKADQQKIDDRYLYKLLKTETFRHIFEINTSSSVDRRGSLRWKEFSALPIPFPTLSEQLEIAEVISVAEKEVALLRTELELLKCQKRGLMQKLLTGEWRVKVDELEVTP